MFPVFIWLPKRRISYNMGIPSATGPGWLSGGWMSIIMIIVLITGRIILITGRIAILR
jgi:hypothetical protein